MTENHTCSTTTDRNPDRRERRRDARYERAGRTGDSPERRAERKSSQTDERNVLTGMLLRF